MAIFKAFALAAILATLTSAAPVQQKRALVYETVTKFDVTTIETTITVFASEATATAAGNPGATQPVVTTTAVPQPPAPSPSTTTTTTSTSSPPPPPAPETTTSAPPPPAVTTTTSAPPPPAVTTTSAPPPPAPSTTTTTTSAAPQPTSTGGSGGETSSGDGTYYQTATSMSAPSYCDTANDGSSENVVALSADIMTQALCGSTITVFHDGKSATGTVVDRCAGCSAGSVDMSEHMFGALASMSAGRIPITWSFNN
ncbi:hypothetical protein PISL3812_02557 [Talaromyces islandicus]|uniref:Uncharacterized protein n=1 Tax=Talaromyces islandicus TaxID=28573 RepID=A0A0U1LQ88_TALIS|nr:hypothetical protein PISL3812_02557 [Talaromyces islandicus]